MIEDTIIIINSKKFSTQVNIKVINKIINV